MTNRIAIFALVSTLIAGGCSTSKSAQESTSDDPSTQTKSGELEAEQTEGTAESNSPGEVDKRRMHAKHQKLVDAYAEYADTYKRRAGHAESPELKTVYGKLIGPHEHMLAKYNRKRHHDRGTSGDKKHHDHAKSGHEKHHRPPPGHVAKMAKMQTKIARLHRRAAELEGEAGRAELNEHHAMMAEGYAELAEMHAAFAEKLREKHAGSEEKRKKAR